MLGPPRRSFASANARAAGKGSQESPEDTVVSFKGGASEKSKSGDALDTRRSIQTNGRYASRPEQESSEDKPRRKVDDDDDTRPKRDHDRKPKWVAGDEEQPHRTKFEQPWFRHDRSGESYDDTRRENKHSDWRRDRGRDRGWERTAPAEEDPEWMDEPVEEQAAPARTQEDFQRWKERMRAGKSATTNNDEANMTPSSPEPTNGKSQKAARGFRDAEADDSMDKFFARLNDVKVTTETTSATKAPTKTRFASLFSPQAEQAPQLPQVSRSPAQHVPRPEKAQDVVVPEKPAATPVGIPSADADQAGFARILEMLQGRSQNATASQAQEPKPRVPLYARDSQSTAEAEKAPPPLPPGVMGLLSQPRSQQTEGQPPHNHDHVQESRSPNEQGHGRQQTNKDELLLNLLRQANQAPKPTPVSPLHDQYGGRSLFSHEDILNRNAMARNQMILPHQVSDPPYVQRRENGRGMIDELPPNLMRYPEDQGTYEHLTRRHTNEAYRSAYDDQAMLSLLRGTGTNVQQRAVHPTQQQQQGPPPGLGRPPGLDQMSRAPPGWPIQPPQPQRQTAPPPGMPNLPRNLPAQYGGSNPPPHQQPKQRPQQPPAALPQQRKYTGESATHNFPPMGPPPGFMNNGPPPGFPGAGYGRYNGPPQEPPQGMGRAFMDMYGDGGRAGVRGGAGGGMSGYR